MAIRFLLESRSSRQVAAVLVVGTIALATAPARADNEPPVIASDETTNVDELLSLLTPTDETTNMDELLSLLSPSDANPNGVGSDIGFSSTSDSVETVPRPSRAGVPYVAVRLEIVNTLEVTTIDLPLDGKLGPDEAREIAYLFRCRRTGRKGQIAPQVLAMLAHVATQWPDRPIQIVSGFRAPPYGAPHSKHFKGLAIDLRIRGVRTARVRDFIWREHHEVGVGFYAKEDFIHMDWRPGEQDRAWTGSEEGGQEEYNPRWARRARRTLPSRGTMVASASGVVGIGQ